ncbi:uncharacterized protein LOC123506106 [Portunus trituberculatus]|uniref:uncharacterized protein LOC123506106 n=1 Tax=Portunus trituberculatus TaxID=210409 RepID=UPI001E1CDD70|nr:uncharacterized protein LOC123506106 [Portunus trituberculatus]
MKLKHRSVCQTMLLPIPLESVGSTLPLVLVQNTCKRELKVMRGMLSPTTVYSTQSRAWSVTAGSAFLLQYPSVVRDSWQRLRNKHSKVPADILDIASNNERCVRLVS